MSHSSAPPSTSDALHGAQLLRLTGTPWTSHCVGKGWTCKRRDGGFADTCMVSTRDCGLLSCRRPTHSRQLTKACIFSALARFLSRLLVVLVCVRRSRTGLRTPERTHCTRAHSASIFLHILRLRGPDKMCQSAATMRRHPSRPRDKPLGQSATRPHSSSSKSPSTSGVSSSASSKS